MSPVSRASASLLLILLLPAAWSLGGGAAHATPAGTAGGAGADDERLHAYAFKHQRASDAIALVHPLLSPRGTIELQPADNTLVIRDNAAAVDKIVAVLRSFDHAPRPLRLDILIVRASRSAVSPQMVHSELPEELTRQLRNLLGYDSYEIEARAALQSLEGEGVTYELGSEYQVSLRLGTVLPQRRVRLTDFAIMRRQAKRPGQMLIRTNMTLWLDRTMSLGLAKSEASREALMVVITVRDGERRNGS
jgi:hypothetical protein